MTHTYEDNTIDFRLGLLALAAQVYSTEIGRRLPEDLALQHWAARDIMHDVAGPNDAYSPQEYKGLYVFEIDTQTAIAFTRILRSLIPPSLRDVLKVYNFGDTYNLPLPFRDIAITAEEEMVTRIQSVSLSNELRDRIISQRPALNIQPGRSYQMLFETRGHNNDPIYFVSYPEERPIDGYRGVYSFSLSRAEFNEISDQPLVRPDSEENYHVDYRFDPRGPAPAYDAPAYDAPPPRAQAEFSFWNCLPS